MLIDTQSQPLVTLNSAMVTGTLTEPVTTMTRPSGTGVFLLGTDAIHPGMHTASAVMLVPFGVGSDAQTFTMNVYGWQRYHSITGQPQYDAWVPVLLATFTAITLDANQAYPSNFDLSAANMFFCRAITLGVGNAGTSVEVVSPAGTNHEIAHIILDTKGSSFLEARYTVGTNTSCNCLCKKM